MLMYMKLTRDVEISLYGLTKEFLRLILVHIDYVMLTGKKTLGSRMNHPKEILQKARNDNGT